MNVGALLHRTFDIRKGEGTSVSLLFAYSFFLGLSVSFYYTAATSLFLARFSASTLPYTFILSGLIGYGLWYVFSASQEKVPYTRLVVFSLLLSLVVVVVLSVLYDQTRSGWSAFVLYIWVKVFMFVNGVGFWGVAARVFDIRQSKRLFGLISSGEVLSYVLGFTSIPFLVRIASTEKVLYLSALALALGLALLLHIMRTLKGSLADKLPTTSGTSATPIAGAAVEPRFYMLVSLLALLPVFSICLADYLFLGQVKDEFGSQEVIARFIGLFFGGMSVLELLMKSFVSGRVVRRFGLRAGLAVLPFVMAFATLMAGISGTALGASGLFFSFLALERFSMRAVRNAFHEPSFQVLYQTIPHDSRSRFQARVEGIAKNLGYIVAGVVLIMLALAPAITRVHCNYFFFAVAIVWLRVTAATYRSYQRNLRQTIHPDESAQSAGQERSVAAQALANDVVGMLDDVRLRRVISFVETVEPWRVPALLVNLLRGAPAIRTRVVEEIRERAVVEAAVVLRELAGQAGSGEERARLVAATEELESLASCPIEELERLGGSGTVSERVRCARLVGVSRRYGAFALLKRLLDDEDAAVRKAALLSAGKSNHPEVWPSLIAHLESPEYRSEAGAALMKIGVPVLRDLSAYADRISVSRALRLSAVRLMDAVGGSEAVAQLRRRIDTPDRGLRNRALAALSRHGYRATASEATTIRSEIGAKIGATVWLAAAIRDMGHGAGTGELCDALAQEFEQKKAEIFLLLALLYDAGTINQIRRHILHGSGDSRMYAIEIIDTIVSQEIKELILPLFDQLPWEEYIRHYRYTYPQRDLTVDERLVDIVNQDPLVVNRWIRACGILLYKEVPSPDEKVLDDLVSACVHPDRFIAETAAWVLRRVAPEVYARCTERFARALRPFGPLGTARDSAGGVNAPATVARVRMLKQAELLSALPEVTLVDLARSAAPLAVNAGDTIPPHLFEGNTFFVVASGTVVLTAGGSVVASAAEGQVADGAMGVAGAGVTGAGWRARESAVLLPVGLGALYDVLVDSPELSRPITAQLLSM